MTSPGPRTSGPSTSRRSALVALAVGSVVLFVGLYFVAVRTEVGQRIDEAAIEGRARDSVVQHAVFRTLDTVSVTSIFLATVALIAIALLRRRPLLAVGIGVLVLGANVTTQVLKDVLTRPDLLTPPTLLNSLAAFPSGHSTVAMSLALALVLAVPARLRLPVGLVGITYAVLVGAATLTGAWHRPSDVLGAYLVTLGWAAAVCAWLVAPRGPQPREPDGNAVVLDGIVIALTLLVIAAALVMGVEVARDARLDQLEVGRAYVASVFAIGAGAVLVLSALVITLDRAPLDPPGLARSRARADRGVSTPFE
jgi:membrane-associated phospholipid phosphatase